MEKATLVFAWKDVSRAGESGGLAVAANVLTTNRRVIQVDKSHLLFSAHCALFTRIRSEVEVGDIRQVIASTTHKTRLGGYPNSEWRRVPVWHTVVIRGQQRLSLTLAFFDLFARDEANYVAERLSRFLSFHTKELSPPKLIPKTIQWG